MKSFGRYLSFVLTLVLLLGLMSAVPAAAQAPNAKLRLMVEFVPGQKGQALDAVMRAGGELHYEFDSLNTIAISVPAQALNGLRNNPNLVYIEEDAPRYPISILKSEKAMSLPTQVVPYGVDMVQARDIWDLNRDQVVDAGAPTGSNRLVCIIDSGMYQAHEDLQATSVVGGYTTISGGYLEDGLGHGTHVAGTIAAVNNSLGVIGVTPGTVNLYIVRVFGNDGSWAYASMLLDAANRCASAGANIISMSLGGTTSSRTEQRGFDSLYAQGVLSIAAAGNDGNTAYSYPASYSSVVSVAAIDENKVVADFSQQNNQVELAAPGVAVLSTVPYLDYNTFAVDGVDYSVNHVEFSARGAASGALVDGGICDTTGAWAGKVVLCQRGTDSFYDKVKNVETSGGAAAVIYNNEPGNFLGTLGTGNTSAIVAVSMSMEDGSYLAANKMGSVASLYSELIQPISNYEYYDGTSMATPHVSAVAALVWGAAPTKTNAEIRAALTATAEDLGVAGKDNAYGYGLVQAKAALDFLGGTPVEPPSGGTLSVADLDGSYALVRNRWTATVKVQVKDGGGNPVSGATVSAAWSGAYTAAATCVTDTSGACSLSTASLKTNLYSVTFSVTNLSAAGFTYDPAANTDPDGDSNGTVITISR